MKFMPANRIAPDGMPHFAASHLGLFCLPMSHKKDTRLISVCTISKSVILKHFITVESFDLTLVDKGVCCTAPGLPLASL